MGNPLMTVSDSWGFCYEVTLGMEVVIVCTLGKATDPFKDALPNICFLKNPRSSTVSSLCRNSDLNCHQVLTSLWFRMYRLYKKKNYIVVGGVSKRSVYDNIYRLRCWAL